MMTKLVGRQGSGLGDGSRGTNTLHGRTSWCTGRKTLHGEEGVQSWHTRHFGLGSENQIQVISFKAGMKLKIAHDSNDRHLIFLTTNGFVESGFESVLGSKTDSFANVK